MSNQIAESNIPTVKPSQLRTLLKYAIPAQLPVMVEGEPAVGKSAIMEQVAREMEHDILISHPVCEDPTDNKGMLWIAPSGDNCHWLPSDEALRLMTADKPLFYFVDDLGQAPPAVKASKMRLFLNREICGKPISKYVYIAAATNGKSHQAGTSAMLEPIKSRFATIVRLVPDPNESCQWYMDNGMPSWMVAFLRFKPELLHQFHPTAELTNSPNLRGWENVAKWSLLKMPEDIEQAAWAGAIGKGAAGELRAFYGIMSELPNLDLIIKEPSKTALPSKMQIRHAVASGLAFKADQSNFDQIATYALRMVADGQMEFVVLLVKDAARRKPEIQKTSGFIRLMADKDLGPCLHASV